MLGPLPWCDISFACTGNDGRRFRHMWQESM